MQMSEDRSCTATAQPGRPHIRSSSSAETICTTRSLHGTQCSPVDDFTCRGKTLNSTIGVLLILDNPSFVDGVARLVARPAAARRCPQRGGPGRTRSQLRALFARVTLFTLAACSSAAPEPELARVPGPTKAEPGKSEPAKSKPVKSEPVKSEPVKSEPVKSEPAKPAQKPYTGPPDRGPCLSADGCMLRDECGCVCAGVSINAHKRVACDKSCQNSNVCAGYTVICDLPNQSCGAIPPPPKTM